MNRKSRLWIGLWLLLVIVTGVLAVSYKPSGGAGMPYTMMPGWIPDLTPDQIAKTGGV